EAVVMDTWAPAATSFSSTLRLPLTVFLVVIDRACSRAPGISTHTRNDTWRQRRVENGCRKSACRPPIADLMRTFSIYSLFGTIVPHQGISPMLTRYEGPVYSKK